MTNPSPEPLLPQTGHLPPDQLPPDQLPPDQLPPGHWETVDPKDLPHTPITEDRHVDIEEILDDSSDDSSDKSSAVPLQRRQQLEHQLRSNPTDLPAFLELATIYRESDRPIEARRVLKQALEVFPKNVELRWEYEEAVLARSLQQLREVTDLATRLQTPETDRELRRSQQDWAQRRIEVCRARLERDPSLVHLNVSLGEAYHDAEDHENAVEVLRRVTDRDDLSSSAYLIIGRSLLAEGKEVEAMAALRACATRRSVIAPARIRVMALRLLCDTAERMGTGLTLDRYRQALANAEKELAG